jgi:hypothetical protein
MRAIAPATSQGHAGEQGQSHSHLDDQRKIGVEWGSSLEKSSVHENLLPKPCFHGVGSLAVLGQN